MGVPRARGPGGRGTGIPDQTGAGRRRGLRPARFSRLASCVGNQGFYAGFQRTDLLRAAGRPQRRGWRDAEIVALAFCAGLAPVRDHRPGLGRTSHRRRAPASLRVVDHLPAASGEEGRPLAPPGTAALTSGSHTRCHPTRCPPSRGSSTGPERPVEHRGRNAERAGAGLVVRVPMNGLRNGQQLAWRAACVHG